MTLRLSRQIILSAAMSVGLLATGFAALAQAKESTPSKPNIIFILSDDLGYGDLGCYGQTKIRTPHIDSLARDGMRFTDHYTGQCVCSPARASLMLGQHMGHCRITSNSGTILKPEETTVAQVLQKAGYHTGMIGKWGLGGAPGHPGAPNNKGFDEWFGFHSQGMAHFYYPEFLWRNDRKIDIPENRDVRENGYYKSGKGKHAHDLFADEAEAFIREKLKSPFFLYLPFAIPHAELIVPADDPDLAYYKSLGWPETPHPEGGGGPKRNAGYGTKYIKGYCAQDYPRATFAAMISRMDRTVGRLLALLKELNIDQNTLVMFSSDNGPCPVDGRGEEKTFFRSSGGLRGLKRTIYEGGIRVPLIARWPGTIKPGSVSSHPCALYDFLPTACELTGARRPQAIDGLSYAPELLGKPQAPPEFLYFMWRNNDAIRAGRWKVHRIKSKGGDVKYELYQLTTDPGEENNCVASEPEVLQQLLPLFNKATQ